MAIAVLGTPLVTGGGSGLTLTQSYTIPTGSTDLYLIVGTGCEDGVSGNTVISGITHNGIALTQEITQEVGTGFRNRSDLWYLPTAGTGTHDVVVTWAGTVDNRLIYIISLSGVANQAPEDSSSISDTLSSSISTSTTSLTDSAMFVDCVVDADLETLTENGSQVKDGQHNSSSSAIAGSHLGGGVAGAQLMGWTMGSALRVALTALCVAPAGVAPTSSTTGILTTNTGHWGGI